MKSLVSQLTGIGGGRAALERTSPDDVVITLAVRSPLCKARRGSFKDTRSDELLTEMFRAAIARSGIDPALIEDVCVGNVLSPGSMYEARAAALAAGIPETTPVQVVNRFCSSGLMAVTTISNQIRAGQIEIGLAVGSDSMSAKYVRTCFHFVTIQLIGVRGRVALTKVLRHSAPASPPASSTQLNATAKPFTFSGFGSALSFSHEHGDLPASLIAHGAAIEGDAATPPVH